MQPISLYQSISFIILSLTLLKGYAATPSSATTINEDVKKFARDTAIAVYDYNYSNYPQQFKTVAAHFTKPAWKAYYANLHETGELIAVKKQQLFVTAKIEKEPVILKQEQVAEKQTWQVQMPLLVIKKNHQHSMQQHMLATLWIEVKPQANTRFLISEFTAEPINTRKYN